MANPASVSGTSAALTARDAAREFTVLALRFAGAFEDLAASATVGPAHERLLAAAASRIVGRHAQAFDDLVPESVLLAEIVADARATTMGAFPVAVAPVTMLHELDAAVDAIAQRASAVADAAFLRVATTVRAELAALVAGHRTPR